LAGGRETRVAWRYGARLINQWGFWETRIALEFALALIWAGAVGALDREGFAARLDDAGIGAA
jgi:hypothetical protein